MSTRKPAEPSVEDRIQELLWRGYTFRILSPTGHDSGPIDKLEVALAWAESNSAQLVHWHPSDHIFGPSGEHPCGTEGRLTTGDPEKITCARCKRLQPQMREARGRPGWDIPRWGTR